MNCILFLFDKKMVRCIVDCCQNNSKTIKNSIERISFFKLPKNKIMRGEWFAKIVKVKLPATIDDARICSSHFTEESFTIPGVADPTYKTRRRILPTAVPTLNLKTMPKAYIPKRLQTTDTDHLKFNVIRRTIEFPGKHTYTSRKRKQSDKGEILLGTKSCSMTPLSLTAPYSAVEQIVTAAPTTLSDPWLDHNYHCALSLPNILATSYDSDECPTSSRCSQRVPKAPRTYSANNVMNVRQLWRKSSSLPKTLASYDSKECPTSSRSSQRLSKAPRTYSANNVIKVGQLWRKSSSHETQTRSTSEVKRLNTLAQNCEESTPPLNRRQRFFMGNCHQNMNNSSQCEKEEDDRTKIIESLKADLEYHRSLVRFYKESKITDLINLESSEAECAKLRLQLVMKEQENKELKEKYENTFNPVNAELEVVLKQENHCIEEIKEEC